MVQRPEAAVVVAMSGAVATEVGAMAVATAAVERAAGATAAAVREQAA